MSEPVLFWLGVALAEAALAVLALAVMGLVSYRAARRERKSIWGVR